MPRVCFTLQVDPSRLEEYRARHAAVWPEMLTAPRGARKKGALQQVRRRLVRTMARPSADPEVG